MMIIPLAAFVLVAILTGSTWRFALVLLLIAPLAAATMWMAGEMFAAAFVYRDVPLRDCLPAGLFGLMFFLPEVLYPPAAWLGACILTVWAVCTLWFSAASFSPARRISLGAVIGTTVGLLFAGLVIASFYDTQFNLEFGSLISLRDEYDLYPFVDFHAARLGILLGLVDGLLVAWRMNGSALEHHVRTTAAISTESN
jgi:hypothetical protein